MTLGFSALQSYHPDTAIAQFSTALGQELRKGSLKDKACAHRAAWCFLQIGRAFELDENQPAANQAYALAHKLDSNDPTIIAFLANGLARTYDEGAAAPLYKRLSQNPFANPCIAASLALHQYRQYNFEAARKLLQDALAQPQCKNNGALEYLLARTLSRLGFSTQASAEYAQASSHADNPYPAQLWKAIGHQLSGKRKEQEADLRKAGEICPDDPAWHAELGAMLLSQEKRDDEARRELEASVQCKRIYAKGFTSLAQDLNNNKCSREAMRCLEYLQKYKPWFADIPYFKAGIYKSMEDWQQAEAQYIASLKLNPRAGVFSTDLATFYAERMQLDKAVAQLITSVTLTPLYIPAWRKLGLIAAQQDNWSHARDYYLHALALVPRPLDKLNDLMKNEVALNHVRIGTYYYLSNDRQHAIEEARVFNRYKFVPNMPYYLTIIKLRPGRLDLTSKNAKEQKYLDHIVLADMLRETRKLDQCVKEYRQAEALNPDDIDLHSYLLDALSEDGKWLETTQEDLIISRHIVNGLPKDIERLTGSKKKTEPSPQSK